MSFSDTGSDGVERVDRYPHPFTTMDSDAYFDDEPDPEDKDSPRTLIELRMCALSAAIREKESWHVKYRDEAIQGKWRKEIEEQQADLHESMRLTNNMINYIMTELDAYAALRDPENGIEVGPYERTWKSDTLITAQLKAALIEAVTPLESVPDEEKDWHPGSNDQVLDLVHPSLYPVVYDRSTFVRSGKPVTAKSYDIKEHGTFTSKRFQWLPSDFDVAADGTVRLASPYINNVHPEDHALLANVIPQLLERAVPMFERVLSDLRREKQLPTRIDLKGKLWPDCVWHNCIRNEPDDDDERQMNEDERRIEAEAEDRGEEIEYNIWRVIRVAWYDKHNTNLNWPESMPAYDGGLDEVQKTVDLRGTRIQVIVKLANIMLTPERPEYGGGKWHVEGMNNEAIVASFIYYYDCENITESTLSFRNAVWQPRYHEQDDSYCMSRLYGIDRDQRCIQAVGKVITKQDRCIAFPNLYQHLVSPFRLADPSKPGHRKILVFFLVDPHIRVASASNVGPQQAAWIRRAFDGTLLWERLPVELKDYIWDYVDAMSDAEAKKYREELMAERTVFVDVVDGERFGSEFNMCEH